MKKLILTTIIVLATVASAFAQVNANVAVTATVEQALTLTPTNVAFGNIQASTVARIKAGASDVTTTEVNIGAAASTGALQIQGSSSVNVTVSWAAGTLRDALEANPTTFTPIVFNGASAISSGDAITITGGNLTLGVGGELAAIANAGVYSTANAGTPVVFTVQYI